jgi:uncharacterized membrane protein
LEVESIVNDVQDAIREILVNAIENAGKTTNNASEAVSGESNPGPKALAAAFVVAAIAPSAWKGVGKLAQELGMDTLDVIKSPEQALARLTASLGAHVGAGIGDKVGQKVDESGGPSAILKDTVKSALPFGGGGGGTKARAFGMGEAQRMPVQQSVDIGVPIETVYNQWTQYELWPEFMHRVTRVTQEDHCTASFAVKVRGTTKEFTASIQTQRPDERIKWKVTQGMAHTGLVTFHQLGPRLTRVLLGLDLEPGSLLEKAARSLRDVNRTARGDLRRFKAFIEMQEVETGAWRGRIEDGALVEDHDSRYDDGREYSHPEATLGNPNEDQAADELDAERQQDEEPPARRRRDGQRPPAPGRTAKDPSSGGGRRSSASSGSSASQRAGKSGQRQRSAPRASGGSSGTKTRGRQATVRKNS